MDGKNCYIDRKKIRFNLNKDQTIYSTIFKFAFALAMCLPLSFNSYAASNECTIKGNVKNNNDGYWELGISGFYMQEIVSIMVDRHGDFSKKISVTEARDLFLSIGEGISFFVVPGDVITINWDENDVGKTLKITLREEERQREVDLVYKTNLIYRKAFSKLYTDMRSKTLTKDEKFNKLNDVFKSHISTIVNSGKPTRYAEKIIGDVYFYYNVNFLDDLNEKSKKTKSYHLQLVDELLTKNWKQFKLMDTVIDNRSLFELSNIYRVFIINKVRAHTPSNYVYKQSSSGQHDTPVKYALAGREMIKKKRILDWYLTYNLLTSYAIYDFENAERAYSLYASEVSTPVFSDTLTKFHEKINRLRPGSPAPNFTLKDVKGKSISLSDFKGKVVYIDFWGIYCGPCLAEIQDYVPALKKKYENQDVIFLNVCIDTNNEKDWKNKVTALNFEGINLIAPNFLENPIAKDFNLGAIPRYILIDKKGSIINATAARPSRLSQRFLNEIDHALK